MAIDYIWAREMQFRAYAMQNPTKKKLEKEIKSWKKTLAKIDKAIASSVSKSEVFDLDKERDVAIVKLMVLKKQYKGLNKVM